MEFERDKKLFLTKEYEFDVTVKGEVGYFAAQLKLSPNGVSIKISGDQLGLRSWGRTPWEMEFLECEGNSKRFTLFELKCVKSGVYSVGHRLDQVSHFDVEYFAKYAVISPASYRGLDLRSIHLLSPSLRNWIGYTEKQQEIVDNQVGGSRVGLRSGYDDFDPFEFCIEVDGNYVVGVNYDFSATISPLAFEVGVRFPPAFCLFANSRILPKDVMPLYQKMYALVSLLHGHELEMDCIELGQDDAHCGQAYLYYARSPVSDRSIGAYSWFPLGHKLRFDDQGFASLPLDAISKYFSTEYQLGGKWEKYIKYRRMANIEDRFLGYFRLLESLTKTSKPFLDPALLKVQVSRVEGIVEKIFGKTKDVKSFLRGLERYNNSKYNTEKCIIDFYKRLPRDVVAGWILKQDAIGHICKLRNDISHANEYFESDDDVWSKCVFVESLLIVALLESIGVPITTSARMIDRLPTSHFLRDSKI